MAFKFEDDENWATEIAEETTKTVYQAATIRIVDPSATSRSYDTDTAQWTIAGDGLVYEGQARVIPVRWGVESGGESQANATTLSAIRIQIPNVRVSVFGDDEFFGDDSPFGDPGEGATFLRVKKGSKVFVTYAPRNQVLQDFIFTVTTDVQGSTAASRTFQAMLDGDVKKGA